MDNAARRTGSYFVWGGQSYGRYAKADHDVWYWTKLERTGPTGEGVAPDDAYLHRDAKPKVAADAIEPRRDTAEDEARQAAQDLRIGETRKAAQDGRSPPQRPR